MLKKSYLIRSAAALALAATLASCGGGGSNYTIGGVIYGLQPNTQLTLTTNGMEVTVTGKPLENNAIPAVSYAFPDKLEYGEVYNVVPKTLSTAADGTVTYSRPAHQNCSASGRISDTAGRLSVISADYTCALVTPSLGGVVKGLTAGSVTLINGSTGGSVTVGAPTTAGDVSFTFPVLVTYGTNYGVTVLSADKSTCTVENGVGTMGDDNVTGLVVNCVANPA